MSNNYEYGEAKECFVELGTVEDAEEFWGGTDGFDRTHPYALGLLNSNRDGLVLLGTAEELLRFADLVPRLIRHRLKQLGSA
ncbi:Uncharacterised protein [Mycobacteroides abscessus subsp. abscessus]|uniref:hypothetical protein n=1 Tax=Mycobacteroides abscessus TaxID=36809 RepID=UPI000926CDCC|nr:hypothetical protein [Mycobacteroides abscessus]SIH39379.1 Uncharacterised protein [Mycobacteroides abscessus subsp. abscessus]